MSASRFIWINLAVNSYFFCLIAGATTSAASAVSTNACYFPDGDLASSYVTCSPNGDGNCCVDGDFCTQWGFCISNSKGYHYRGACTDSTWGNPSCPTACMSDINSGNSSAVNLIACDAATTDGSWCCAYDGNCCSNSSAVYTPGFGTIFAEGVAATQTLFTSMITVGATGAPITVTATMTMTATPIAPAAASSETSTEKKDKDNTPTVVGAAVGIPLGLAALAGFIFFYMERRKRIGTERATQQHAAEWTDMKQFQSPTSGIDRLHPGGSQTQILSQQYQQPPPPPPPPQQHMGFFAPDSNMPKDSGAYELSTARTFELGNGTPI